MNKKLLLMAILLYSVCSSAQPTLGLMAYWNMNGNFSDNGPYNIIVTNTGATPTTNNQGGINKAMNFLNPVALVAQYATQAININVNFGTAQDFSIDFSVLTSSQPRAGGIYDNNLNYGGPGVFMWNSNGFPQINFNFKNGNIGSTNGALPIGFWKHVCCVRAGTALKIYVNGILNATGTAGATAPVYSFTGRFGTMFFNGFAPPQYNGHNGKIDEFRIYNRALTDIEILGLSVLALPIKLSSFTAVNNNNAIALNWQTQYEQNSSHFNIQRSTDGINFADVARVSAAGNTDSISNYHYIDVLSASLQKQNIIYYRIQAVDIEKNFVYSPVIALRQNNKEIQLLVFPNPAKDILQVQTSNGITGNASLVISDASGMQVYKRQLILQPGSNSMPVNISLFKSGIYYLRLVSESGNYTKQFVKGK